MPTNKNEMQKRGWREVDFAYVIGDAYVDHPSFGPAIISRVLEAAGYKVGIIAQPNWKDPASIDLFGKPRLGFLVSAGNMDSMVNHFTVNKKPRRRDSYSPGGKMGLRPNRACIVYGNLIRQRYKTTPIILGGIEASLRRLAHYDYWSNKLRRSILMDSGADMISYGMGEKSILEVADALAGGISISDICWIKGTVFKSQTIQADENTIILPPWEKLQKDKRTFATSFLEQSRNCNHALGKTLVEEYPHRVFVVQNPPSDPLSTEEMDTVYELPYVRDYHPRYKNQGGVPALNEVRFSITHNRGCMGECAFCALNFHQGRIVQSRSHESILKEARLFLQDPLFKGIISDVGGPTANFRTPACKQQPHRGACAKQRCLSPKPCKQLVADHSDYIALLRKLRTTPGIKKVFIRSGIRFDYVLQDKKYGAQFIEELAQHHTSGQLRLAPEHSSEHVLNTMGKPSWKHYATFCRLFQQASKKAHKKQYVLPYLMSSHPGATLSDAIDLAQHVKELGFYPEQVQDFYPTPSTMATCMYYTGIDPRTNKHIDSATSAHEKAMQRALIQYSNPANHKLVLEALTQAHRTDLIGSDKQCLVDKKIHSNKTKRCSRNRNCINKKQNSGKRKSRSLHKSSKTHKSTNARYKQRKKHN